MPLFQRHKSEIHFQKDHRSVAARREDVIPQGRGNDLTAKDGEARHERNKEK